MTKVLFTEAARSDIADAVAWYEAHAPEVTPLFLEAVRAVAERIAQNPRQFPASSHETRRALLRRFPYLVIFRETPDAAIVVAVFHTRRDPREWRARTE